MTEGGARGETPTRELLAEALSSAENLRNEISELKSKLNAQALMLPTRAASGELLGASCVGLLPLGSSSPDKPHARLALPVVVLDGSQLQGAMEGDAAAVGKAPSQQRLVEPTPSAQASLARHASLVARLTGEQQVPPKSVDSELPWKISAVSPPAGRLAAEGRRRGGGDPASPTLRQRQQQQGSYASTARQTADAAVGTSPAGQLLGEAGSIDFAALAAALQREQEQQGGQKQGQGDGGQGLEQGQKGPTQEPAAKTSLRAASLGFGDTQGPGMAASKSRQKSTYASIHRSTPRGGQRSSAQLPEQLQLLEQWSESQALQRLLQNLEQANALKQASDTRMKKVQTPRESKEAVTPREGSRLSSGAKAGPGKPSRDQQRPSLREPKERTQPFVPRPAGPSAAAAPTPPASARRRESHFSLAGLVAAELVPASNSPKVSQPVGAAGRNYASSPRAAKTALAAKAAGGVIAAPPRASSPRPAVPRVAGAQPTSPRTASLSRAPALWLRGSKSPSRSGPLWPAPHSAEPQQLPQPGLAAPQPLAPSPPPAQQEPAQRQQQQQDAPVEPSTGAPSQGREVQPTGWSDASEVPLRVYYSRLTNSSSCITAGEPSLEVGSPAVKPTVQHSSTSSSCAVDVGPLQAAAPQGGPFADSKLGWGWPPPLQQGSGRMQEERKQARPQQEEQQEQEQLTPRLQERAATKLQRGRSFMQLLVEKLTPFHKLQSPPATPADAAPPKGQGRVASSQGHPRVTRSLSAFPNLGQHTALAPAPGLDSPCKAISGAGADSTIAASMSEPAGATASSGQALATPRAAGAQQQPARGEGTQLQPQVGMKRAPPSAIEAPNSLKKRTPLPSRGPSHSSEIAEAWGPPQPFPSLEQAPSQQGPGAAGSPPALLAPLGTLSPVASPAQPGSSTIAVPVQEWQPGAEAEAQEQAAPPSPGKVHSGVPSPAEQSNTVAAVQEGQAGAAAGEGGRQQRQQQHPREEQAPSRLRQRVPSRTGRFTPVPLVQPVCAITRSPMKRPVSSEDTKGEAGGGEVAVSAEAAVKPGCSTAGFLSACAEAGESELLRSTSSFVPPLAVHLAALPPGEPAEGALGRQQQKRQQPGSGLSSPSRVLSKSSQAGRSYAEMHFMRPTLSSSSKKWTPPGSPRQQATRSSSPSGTSAWKPPSTVVPSQGSPPRSPTATLRQPSVRAAGYAQQALIRRYSQLSRTTRATSASTETHSAVSCGRGQQPPPEGAGQQGVAAASTMPSPSKELPSESTWQEMPHGGDDPAGQQGASLEAQTVTVLIGGIHAVHRQRQLKRAGSSGVARRPSSAEADLAAQAVSEGSAGAGSSVAAGRQHPGVAAVHLRTTRMAAAPAPEGVSLRDDALGKTLLEETPEFDSVTSDHLLLVLKEGRMVRKSWVRPDFKKGGSTRLVQCALGAASKVLLQYQHGLFRKPLQCMVKRVIIPSTAGWRQGQYLVVDTDRGMLRIEPSSKGHYALWVLGLNAALNLAAQRGAGGLGRASGLPAAAAVGLAGMQLAADQPWNSNFLIG